MSGGEWVVCAADPRVIPVVVAKCGLYLKENGTEVEGAFRISGSTRRMRDLQAVFDTGPKVGTGLASLTAVWQKHQLEDAPVHHPRRCDDIQKVGL